MSSLPFTVDGLILAGGRGERLGGVDKGLQPLQGKPLIDWTLDVLRPQVAQLLINCNRNPEQYRPRADRLVSDARTDFAGPLHGVLSGLQASSASHLLVLPCDTPLLTGEVLGRLIEAARETPEQIIIAATEQGWQPLHVVIPQQYQGDLAAWLAEGNAKVRSWYQRHPHRLIAFGDEPAFHNVNSPEELQAVSGKPLER
ncbi:molybdenum cofactor guanylyltransferase MobA [Marinobacterium arenosum]|uniref:molybdenum cofactor guanylyltransferase MobA n=1 Tax=Marinobacterium arenosum TaxID=2862496 RepID=UPI001C964633|nr:molybdenum cofactor guanylyltransferase MobA [Marinobacterium arenosum]MBY4676007.1 molybdenum cofactor guanylyltransferase [Marinobacterium arenosum]